MKNDTFEVVCLSPSSQSSPVKGEEAQPRHTTLARVAYPRPTRNPRLETQNSREARLRRSRHGDLQHRRCQRAAIGPVESQTVLSGADDSLRCGFVDDVAVVDRPKHVGVILISNHVHLGVDIERLNGAPQISDLFVGISLCKSPALDDGRIVFSFRDVIYGQRFDPGPGRREIHPCIDRSPRAGQQLGFRSCRRHLIVRQVGRAHTGIKDQLVLFMLPDSAFDIQWRLDRCRGPAVAPAFNVVRIMQVQNFFSRLSQLHREKLPVFRSFEMTIDNSIKLFSYFRPQTHVFSTFLSLESVATLVLPYSQTLLSSNPELPIRRG